MSRNPYVRPISTTTWYMRNGRYKVYVLRELTSFLVMFYSFLTIYGLAALAGSAERWDAFLASQQSTAMVVFHGWPCCISCSFRPFPGSSWHRRPCRFRWVKKSYPIATSSSDIMSPGWQ